MSLPSDRGLADAEPQYDAGNSEHVQERKKLTKILAASRINGLKKLAADKDGRAWIWQFLDQASPFASAFDGSSSTKTAFNCGAKIMTVQIMEQMLTNCPAEYYLMLSEAKERPERHKEKHDA